MCIAIALSELGFDFDFSHSKLRHRDSCIHQREHYDPRAQDNALNPVS
jgi:hypothetical protein